MTKPNDHEDYALAGDVSVEEAREALQRFVDSHFDNPGEHARISIPANPRRDDDIRLSAFITRAEKAFAELDAAREEAAQWKRLAEQTTDARLAEAIASREAMRRERDEAREETRREVQRVLDSPCVSCRDNVDARDEARAQLAAIVESMTKERLEQIRRWYAEEQGEARSEPTIDWKEDAIRDLLAVVEQLHAAGMNGGRR